MEGLCLCVFWIIRPVLIKNLDLIEVIHVWVNLWRTRIPRLPRLSSAGSRKTGFGLLMPSIGLLGGFEAGLGWIGRDWGFPWWRESLQKDLSPSLVDLSDCYCCFLLDFIFGKWAVEMGARIYMLDVRLAKSRFRASRAKGRLCWWRGRFWGRAEVGKIVLALGRCLAISIVTICQSSRTESNWGKVNKWVHFACAENADDYDYCCEVERNLVVFFDYINIIPNHLWKKWRLSKDCKHLFSAKISKQATTRFST